MKLYWKNLLQLKKLHGQLVVI
ncbi:hypothetical protein Gohar_024996 [Gossypium harknessii]|uniref:Uncharacterized protein n=1 Tax=Gossypium harknessii TaxID=34285 RepID=A0A7J9HHP4_9ROSI|nr:hypothetical protein [Gossypium harknessii]